MISNESINDCEFKKFPYLNIDIPMIDNIPDKYLLPYNMWSSRELYYENLMNIITEFNDLFKKKFGEELYNFLLDE
jgi:ATP-dependent phosphoenolpyruvate carboxykinase